MNMAMAGRVKEMAPDLHALLTREGAVFVDIGVGGAGGACAIAKLYPKLRVIGVDPLPAALAEARANIAARGLSDRIELRAQRGDELTEPNSIDIAFLPAKFFGDEGVIATFRALSRSLKPDGIIMTAAWRDVGEPRAAAVSKLRNELWGAGPRTTEEITAIAIEAGFKKITVGPTMGATVALLVKRQ
jgi:precorrin-6B methylase 2